MTFWHNKSFDRLRNPPAILKYVVFVTTSPGLPYAYTHVHSYFFVRNFLWRIVSQKTTLIGKWLMFQKNTNAHSNTRTLK